MFDLSIKFLPLIVDESDELEKYFRRIYASKKELLEDHVQIVNEEGSQIDKKLFIKLFMNELKIFLTPSDLRTHVVSNYHYDI